MKEKSNGISVAGTTLLGGLLLVVLATSATAVVPADDKCESSKNKTAGTYYSCLAKTLSKSITKGTTPDYSRCEDKFASSWDKAEEAGGAACVDTALTDEMADFLFAQQAATAAIIAGTKAIPVCGDGEINVAGEQCDGTDLGGATCASLSHFDGNLTCDASCRLDASTCISCPSGSSLYEGGCWLLAQYSESCDAACVSVGLACDEAALLAVGSEGTNESCQAALDATDPAGAPYPILPGSPGDASSCGTDLSGGGCARINEMSFPQPEQEAGAFIYTGSPTTCAADLDSGSCAAAARRVCACKQ